MTRTLITTLLLTSLFAFVGYTSYNSLSPTPATIAEVANTPTSTLTVVPNSTTLRVGSSYTLTLQTNIHTHHLTAAQIEFSYDQSTLTLSSPVPHASLSTVLISPTLTSGTFRWAGGIDPAKKDTAPSGDFALLTFNLTPKKTGTTLLTFAPNNIILSLESDTNLLSTIASPTLTILPAAIAGDLNNDGRVDLLDFRLVIQGYGTTYTLIDFRNVVVNYGKTS